ncbi:MAG TPA: ACT domain-containing protein [Cyclobacteriaceae bacterium]|nr:ACT domain-containing protein [Cyclobacteriaceae bacterium]
MQTGETNLATILKSLSPFLNPGSYVFCPLPPDREIDNKDILCSFRESEGTCVIVTKETADRLNMEYTVVMSWITLTVHSSLEAVGLTAAFSKALTNANVSCNVVAALNHDHIFVPEKDAPKAMTVLAQLS